MKDLVKEVAATTEEKAAKAEKLKASTKPTPVVETAFTLAKGKETAYQMLKDGGNQGAGADMAKAAFTQAVLDVTNGCNVSAKGVISKSAKPFNRELFDACFNDGGKVYRYHAAKGTMNEDGLTSEGVVWFQNRIKGEGPAFNTQISAIKELTKLVTKGGKRSKFKAADDAPVVNLHFANEVSGEL